MEGRLDTGNETEKRGTDSGLRGSSHIQILPYAHQGILVVFEELVRRRMISRERMTSIYPLRSLKELLSVEADLQEAKASPSNYLTLQSTYRRIPASIKTLARRR